MYIYYSVQTSLSYCIHGKFCGFRCKFIEHEILILKKKVTFLPHPRKYRVYGSLTITQVIKIISDQTHCLYI